MSMVEMVGATVRRASPGVLLPRLPVRSPSDHSLFAGSPDLLTYGCAHIGFDSLQFTIDEIKNEPEDSFFISWWRWRVTIHYHGKCKMDNLSKTGTAPDLTLILIINLKVFCKVTFRIISASIKLMSGTSAFFRYSQF